MVLSIAVIGNSGLNIGAAMAGDLALAGHDVRFQLWGDQLDCLDAIRAEGGVRISPPATETVSGRSGLGTPRILTDDPAEAVAGADLIVMDVAALELEDRACQLIPCLENGQVLHVNTHGCWPALRLAPLLRDANKVGVIVTEGVTPTLAAGRSEATVTPLIENFKSAPLFDLTVECLPSRRIESIRIAMAVERTVNANGVRVAEELKPECRKTNTGKGLALHSVRMRLRIPQPVVA